VLITALSAIDARRTMQTNMLTAGADFKLVLTLNTEIALGTDTVLPVAMSLITISIEFGTEILEVFGIFGPCTAFSVVPTLKIAFNSSLIGMVFTRRSMVVVFALTSFKAE